MIGPGTLLIRADGDGGIGIGHLMRCLALAEGWLQQGGSRVMLFGRIPEALKPRLQELEIVPKADVGRGDPTDAERTAALARHAAATWVVVDGYAFGSDFQTALKAAGQRLFCIDDDAHSVRYVADLLLNQNLHAQPNAYGEPRPGMPVLLGPRYALLRREFRDRRRVARVIVPAGRRVLIAFGGADPQGMSALALNALFRLMPAGFDVRVVVGPANPHRKELERLAESAADRVSIVANADMPALMAWCDLAICGAGISSWELAFMGTPAIVVATANNQRPIAASLGRARIAIDAGWHADLEAETYARLIGEVCSDPVHRADMSTRGQALVDGRGAERVVHAMVASASGRDAPA